MPGFCMAPIGANRRHRPNGLGTAARTICSQAPLPRHRPPVTQLPPSPAQRGIQSIEVGGQLLRALAHAGRPLPLKDLAAAAGMAAAKAHPYLVSFGKIGLVEQDRSSGRYGLGPLALQLGLMSLQQADPVRIATPLIEDLAAASGHTVAIAVWGTHGPTIVRLAESPAAVHVNMRHGTVFSITGTASGQLFAAYLGEASVRPLYEAERQAERQSERQSERQAARRSERQSERRSAVAPDRPGWALFDATTLTEVRAQGLARADGGVVAGVSALAAPVLDHSGQIVLSLTAIGPSAAFDTRWDGPLAALLRQAAQAASARLGWQPASPPAPS